MRSYGYKESPGPPQILVYAGLFTGRFEKPLVAVVNAITVIWSFHLMK